MKLERKIPEFHDLLVYMKARWPATLKSSGSTAVFECVAAAIDLNNQAVKAYIDERLEEFQKKPDRKGP